MATAAARPASLPRDFWFVWLGILVNRMGTFVLPFLSIYLVQRQGYTVATAGALMALYSIGVMLSGVIGGVLADTIGRRETMALGLVCSAAAVLAIGMSRGLAITGLILVFAGVAADLYRPAAMALLADVLPQRLRTRGYGHLYWATNLGISLAAILAGVLAAVDFWYVFVGDAAASVLAAAIVWFGTRRNERITSCLRRGEAYGSTRWLTDPTYVLFVLLSFATFCIYFQQSVALPVFMTSTGVSTSVYGLIMAVNGVTVVLVQPALTRVLEKLPRSRVLAASAVLMGAGFGMYAVVDTPMMFGLAVLVWTVGEIGMAPAVGALVADLSPEHLRGTYQGIHSTAFGAARLTGAGGGGLIAEVAGPPVLWLTCFGLGLTVAVGHLLMASRYRQRGAEVASPDPSEIDGVSREKGA